MIGRAMEKWPDDALRRVCDAPIEGWTSGVFLNANGQRCLIGHAADARPELWRSFDVNSEWIFGAQRYLVLCTNPITFGQFGFDRLCNRFGIPRTVRAIKARALRILLQRNPLEARVQTEGAAL